MNDSNQRFRVLRPFAVAVLALSASLAANAARYVTEVVTVAPPAPVVETVGVAPHPGWIWRPGYYNWVDGHHVWINGTWMEPRAGYRWHPHVWVKEHEGWRLREGYWAR